jgi:hypothetical protein
MIGLFGLVVLILDIIAILDVLKSTASAEKKALWVVLIILLPFVGMVLYFLLKKGK